MNSMLSKRLVGSLTIASLVPTLCLFAANPKPAPKSGEKEKEKSFFDKANQLLKDAGSSLSKVDARTEKFFKDSGMTKDQMDKFNAIISDQTKQVQAIDKKLALQDQLNKIGQIFAGTDAKVKAILTPEQRRHWAPYYAELSAKSKQDANKALAEGAKVIGQRNKQLEKELKDK